MKIAIVTSHPVPFALGGAENLWWGLQSAILEETDHTCDIIAVPTPEHTFAGLISSYETFSKLDLSEFDCVISGKYPAWMIQHPHHVCYMLHRLRGVYDTYAGEQLGHLEGLPSKVQSLVRWMREFTELGMDVDQAAIASCFDRLRTIELAALPERLAAFPGPLSREIVHFLDRAALAPNRITKYAAISGTVAKRPDYFPDAVDVEILYPPPHRTDYHCGSDNYLFTNSRLDKVKRVDLIIDAMKSVEADIPLLIAGTGPEEANLRAQAANDPRIQFLGYVDDDKMPELYAHALAVPFVPLDEDYGLVTIEAMKSGKPVLTVSDSGGPCEFVRDCDTGFVCAPDGAALGLKLNTLCKDRKLARKMGECARDSVAAIHWSGVQQALLQRADIKSVAAEAKSVRPSLVVATTFPVYPPTGGGQSRVFHLYRHLAQHLDIHIVSLGEKDAGKHEIAPGLIETRIARTKAQSEFERELAETVNRTPVGDITADMLIGLSPEYTRHLSYACKTADAVIACHPYLIRHLIKAAPAVPLWYEAQDVEIKLKTELLAGYGGAEHLLEHVSRLESQCWRQSEHVFTCAERDLSDLETIYGPTLAHQYTVPNGVSLDDVSFTELPERRRLQALSGMNRKKTALFVGSWHGPNIEAVERILNAADKLSDLRFVIIGSVCRPFEKKPRPQNVDMLGLVSDEQRNDLFAACDLALNPMEKGSGTNLKMLDYFCAGIPVVSSKFGTRGLRVEPDTHLTVYDDQDLEQAIQEVLSTSEELLADQINNARALVRTHYDWSVIANQFIEELRGNNALRLRPR